jgi:hypothetical protein
LCALAGRHAPVCAQLAAFSGTREHSIAIKSLAHDLQFPMSFEARKDVLKINEMEKQVMSKEAKKDAVEQMRCCLTALFTE